MLNVTQDNNVLEDFVVMYKAAQEIVIVKLISTVSWKQIYVWLVPIVLMIKNVQPLSVVIRVAVYPPLAVVMKIVMPNKAVQQAAVFLVSSVVMIRTALFRAPNVSIMFAKFRMVAAMMQSAVHSRPA